MAGFAQIGRHSSGPSVLLSIWADATSRLCSRSRVARGVGSRPGPGVARRSGLDRARPGVARRSGLGVAGLGAAPGRATVPRAAHPVHGGPPGNRYRSGEPRGAGAGRRHGALLGHSGRPRGAVDRTLRRAAVELRAGDHAAEARRRGAPRRPGRHAAAGALLRPVPALRGPAGWRVRFASAVSRRGATVGAAADPTARRARDFRATGLRRAGAPSRSSL